MSRGIPVSTIERNAEDKLPQYSSIGCYTILYLSKASEPLCADCASDPENKADVCGDFAEGAPIECAVCGKQIESSYGDPDAEADPDADESEAQPCD